MRTFLKASRVSKLIVAPLFQLVHLHTTFHRCCNTVEWKKIFFKESLSNQSTLYTDGFVFRPFWQHKWTGNPRIDFDYTIRWMKVLLSPWDLGASPILENTALELVTFGNCRSRALFCTQAKCLHCIGLHERRVRGSTAVINSFFSPTAAHNWTHQMMLKRWINDTGGQRH